MTPALSQISYIVVERHNQSYRYPITSTSSSDRSMVTPNLRLRMAAGKARESHSEYWADHVQNELSHFRLQIVLSLRTGISGGLTKVQLSIHGINTRRNPVDLERHRRNMIDQGYRAMENQCAPPSSSIANLQTNLPSTEALY